MIRLLLIAQTCGPDYLSDLVFRISKQHHVEYTNFIAYTTGIIITIKFTYGRGFTAFGLLDNTIDIRFDYNLPLKFVQSVDGQQTTRFILPSSASFY